MLGDQRMRIGGGLLEGGKVFCCASVPESHANVAQEGVAFDALEG
jgi:hypothetical protein